MQAHVISWLHGRPRVRWVILAVSAAAGIALLPLLDARLLPDFRENYLIAHASLRPGVSLQETLRIGGQISRDLHRIPGVKSVAEQIGRAENGQDPDAPNKSEFEIQIDPRSGRGAGDIDADIRRVFEHYPNELVEIYSVLAERIGETIAGESAPFSISVIGSDLDADDRVGAQIVAVLQDLPGSGNVRMVVPPRQVELQVELSPGKLASHGLQNADVLETINAAYHGVTAAESHEADRTVPIVVRILGAGADPHALGRLLVRGRDGTLLPLSSVASIQMVPARGLIDHQDGLRRQIVVVSPRVQDQVGYAKAARAAIAAKIELPAGVFLVFGGAAEAHAAAVGEMLLHSAAALVVIVLLLARAFGSWRQIALVLLALPSTLIGGGAALAVTGGTLTLGAMVGFVALFGMAARNTILLISHYDHLVHEERAVWDLRAALRGAVERFTPVVLTSLLTGLALLPAALQLKEAGHEIEGPMAVVIIGGLISSTLVTLLVIPPLAATWLHSTYAPIDSLES